MRESCGMSVIFGSIAMLILGIICIIAVMSTTGKTAIKSTLVDKISLDAQMAMHTQEVLRHAKAATQNDPFPMTIRAPEVVQKAKAATQNDPFPMTIRAQEVVQKAKAFAQNNLLPMVRTATCRGTCSRVLISPDGSSVAKLSPEGMLVIYKNESRQWTNGANGKNGPYKLQMQEDGNLVIYDKNNVAKWASGGGGGSNGPYKLTMQNDGNLVIYDKNNAASWASQSAPQY
jgi:hypothetical protein